MRLSIVFDSVVLALLPPSYSAPVPEVQARGAQRYRKLSPSYSPQSSKERNDDKVQIIEGDSDRTSVPAVSGTVTKAMLTVAKPLADETLIKGTLADLLVSLGLNESSPATDLIGTAKASREVATNGDTARNGDSGTADGGSVTIISGGGNSITTKDSKGGDGGSSTTGDTISVVVGCSRIIDDGDERSDSIFDDNEITIDASNTHRIKIYMQDRHQSD